MGCLHGALIGSWHVLEADSQGCSPEATEKRPTEQFYCCIDCPKRDGVVIAWHGLGVPSQGSRLRCGYRQKATATEGFRASKRHHLFLPTKTVGTGCRQPKCLTLPGTSPRFPAIYIATIFHHLIPHQEQINRSQPKCLTRSSSATRPRCRRAAAQVNRKGV